jgi:hypothetical protein
MVYSIGLLWRSWDMTSASGQSFEPLEPFIVVEYDDGRPPEICRCRRDEAMTVFSRKLREVWPSR